MDYKTSRHVIFANKNLFHKSFVDQHSLLLIVSLSLSTSSPPPPLDHPPRTYSHVNTFSVFCFYKLLPMKVKIVQILLCGSSARETTRDPLLSQYGKLDRVFTSFPLVSCQSFCITMTQTPPPWRQRIQPLILCSDKVSHNFMDALVKRAANQFPNRHGKCI